MLYYLHSELTKLVTATPAADRRGSMAPLLLTAAASSLSISELKATLRARGISYEGLLEKHELCALVERSRETIRCGVEGGSDVSASPRGGDEARDSLLGRSEDDDVFDLDAEIETGRPTSQGTSASSGCSRSRGGLDSRSGQKRTSEGARVRQGEPTLRWVLAGFAFASLLLVGAWKAAAASGITPPAPPPAASATDLHGFADGTPSRSPPSLLLWQTSRPPPPPAGAPSPPPPSPPPPPPLPPPSSPIASPPLSAHDVLTAINERFYHGGAVSDVRRAGVFARLLDPSNDPERPWLPCKAPHWCEPYGDRLPASLLNPRAPHLYSKEGLHTVTYRYYRYPISIPRRVYIPLRCGHGTVTLLSCCRHVTVASPSRCRYITVTLPSRYLHVTVTSPSRHRYVADTSPLRYRSTSITPLHSKEGASNIGFIVSPAAARLLCAYSGDGSTMSYTCDAAASSDEPCLPGCGPKWCKDRHSYSCAFHS